MKTSLGLVLSALLVIILIGGGLFAFVLQMSKTEQNATLNSQAIESGTKGVDFTPDSRAKTCCHVSVWTEKMYQYCAGITENDCDRIKQ